MKNLFIHHITEGSTVYNLAGEEGRVKEVLSNRFLAEFRDMKFWFDVNGVFNSKAIEIHFSAYVAVFLQPPCLPELPALNLYKRLAIKEKEQAYHITKGYVKVDLNDKSIHIIKHAFCLDKDCIYECDSDGRAPNCDKVLFFDLQDYKDYVAAL